MYTAGREKGKVQPPGLFFHRLRPPDELHGNQTITGAQIRSGETRQDLKIPTVSDGSLPRALSCSHPEVLPVAVRRSVTVVAFSHSCPCNWVPVRRFAPSWTICTNSPFSPTTAPVQVTVLLRPTLKDTTTRHWR